MKLRWWLVGALAVATGSVLVLRHILDEKRKNLHFIDNDNGKNFGEFPPEIPESEFEEVDFLA